MPRPLNGLHGGVACLIRGWLIKCTRVERKHRDLGIMWLRITLPQHGTPIFVAVCYLPPAESTYYRDTPHDRASHFETLSEDVAHFSLRGRIVMGGDFNARVGTSSDISEAVDWDGMAESGIPIPTTLKQQHIFIQSLPTRMTQDTARCNAKMGTPLLEICKKHQLVILNGRLIGDDNDISGGAHTFTARGREHAQSLIDYFIATPSLCFREGGSIKEGCTLRVTHELQNIGETDHACVALQINIEATNKRVEEESMRNSIKTDGDTGTIRYRFNPEHIPAYVQLLKNERWAAELDKIGGEGMKAEEAVHIFGDTIRGVLKELDLIFGGTIIPGKKCDSNIGNNNGGIGKVTNIWYSDECKQLQKLWQQAERTHGRTSDITITARRTYRMATRTARRMYEQQHARELAEQWKYNPRAFWQTFKDNTQQSALTDLGAWAEYFAALYQANVHGRAYPTINEHCAAHGLLYPEATDHARYQAQGLNHPISEAEVLHAVDMLRNNKSPGVDGIPSEFYKHATYELADGGKINILIPVLTRLFNSVLKDSYPSEWSVGALVPLLKPKGNAYVMDDYRGIAVGPAIAKIYSIVMNTRGDKWAEANEQRAHGQFGFRHGRGTVQAMFVLRHTIEKYKYMGKPLYCAFIDFRKAYDSVDRELLWKALHGMGVHGAYMSTLQQMYSNVRMRVRLKGGLSANIPAEAGVMQGDSLSPLLFGLFMDRIEQYLCARLGHDVGVRIAGRIVHVLLYADDLALMAETPEQLQCMLDCLADFCSACMMTVNIPKSKIVCFNRQNAPRAMPVWIYGGQKVPVVSEFKYLGLLFHEAGGCGGVKGARDRQLKASKFAAHELLRRCQALGLKHVHTLCYLFNALVKPIASYGCEVWAPDIMCKHRSGELVREGEQEKMVCGFLRHITGVHKCTPTHILLRELGIKPMWLFWMKQCVSLWNKTRKLSHDDLIKSAMLESVHMALGAYANSSANRECWAYLFLRCMCALGVINHPQQALETEGDGQRQQLAAFDIDIVMAAAQRQTVETWAMAVATGDPRGIPNDQHEGVKLATYAAWFAADDVSDTHSTFAANLDQWQHITTVACFRMGSHRLDVNTRRWGPDKVGRSQRLCYCCEANTVEDEKHVVMECPAYHAEREIFLNNIQGHADTDNELSAMRAWMNGDGTREHWQAVARFLISCRRVRAKLRCALIGKEKIPASWAIDM